MARSMVPVHVDTVPSHPIRPMVAAGAPTAKVGESTVVESGVSGAPHTLAKDQRWTVRPEQEYKFKIHGKGQRTGPEHAPESYRQAIELAKKDHVVRVHLNQGYRRATGIEVKPNRQPDVLWLHEDGTFHAIEVASKTDNIAELYRRNKEVMDQLPEHMQGTITIIEYKAKPVVTKTGGE